MNSFAERPIRLVEQVRERSENLKNIGDICDKLCAFIVDGDDGRQFDESLCELGIAEAVWSVIAEASKHSLDEHSLEELLPHSAISSAIITNYKIYKDRLQEQLSTVGWEYPRVVDINWKLSSVLETNQGKESDGVAEISLDTIATGSCDIERISFQCDINQLQDLYWTLKEAQNSLQNIAQS